MPERHHIVTAVKNLDIFLRIKPLKGAVPQMNTNCIPFSYSGGYNMVFLLHHNSEKWALRVSLLSIPEVQRRYEQVSRYLQKKQLPYFLDYYFDKKGLLVNGELIDTIRMRWYEGCLLKEYIENNLGRPGRLSKLAENFFQMCKLLHSNKISHGDLHEGNIIIGNSDDIKLLDYDSICIPATSGQREQITGYKGYQHPSRFKHDRASLKADYFSELVIYLSLLALSEQPDLFEKYKVKETQYLLFTEEDYNDFEHSTIFNDLQSSSTYVKFLLNILVDYLKAPSFEMLSPFYVFLAPPKIVKFACDQGPVAAGMKITLSWEVQKASKVAIEPGIGTVTEKGKKSLYPKADITYILTAENEFGTCEEDVQITLFPTPLIESILVPTPVISTKIELKTIEFKGSDIIQLSNEFYGVDSKMRNKEELFSISGIFSKIKLSIKDLSK